MTMSQSARVGSLGGSCMQDVNFRALKCRREPLVPKMTSPIKWDPAVEAADYVMMRTHASFQFVTP